MCSECRIGKRKPWQNWGVATWLRKTKAQQGSTQSKTLKGTADREVRKIFKILREMWLNIEIKKVNTHEGVIVKALLDSEATGMFINKKTTEKYSFRLWKLERLLIV